MTTEDNFKTQAHKICQKNHLPLPVYTIQEDESEHYKRFTATCELIGLDGEKVVGPAKKGKSKSIAEHYAAMSTLEIFKQRYPEARGLPKEPVKKNKSAPKKKSKQTNASAKNLFPFIGKLNNIAKSSGFSKPKYEINEAKSGQLMCICLLDTPDGEQYSTASSKDRDTAKNAAAFAMLKILEEDRRAREIAQGLLRGNRVNR